MLRCKFLPKGEGIELVGTLDKTTVNQLEKFLASCKNGNFKIDMSGLVELQREGMRPILMAHKRLKDAGGGIRLVNPTPAIHEMLDREGLLYVLTVVHIEPDPEAQEQE